MHRLAAFAHAVMGRLPEITVLVRLPSKPAAQPVDPAERREHVKAIRLILRWAHEYYLAGDVDRAEWFARNGAALVARHFPEMSVAQFQVAYDVFTGSVSTPINTLAIA